MSVVKFAVNDIVRFLEKEMSEINQNDKLDLLAKAAVQTSPPDPAVFQAAFAQLRQQQATAIPSDQKIIDLPQQAENYSRQARSHRQIALVATLVFGLVSVLLLLAISSETGLLTGKSSRPTPTLAPQMINSVDLGAFAYPGATILEVIEPVQAPDLHVLFQTSSASLPDIRTYYFKTLADAGFVVTAGPCSNSCTEQWEAVAQKSDRLIKLVVYAPLTWENEFAQIVASISPPQRKELKAGQTLIKLSNK